MLSFFHKLFVYPGIKEFFANEKFRDFSFFFFFTEIRLRLFHKMYWEFHSFTRLFSPQVFIELLPHDKLHQTERMGCLKNLTQFLLPLSLSYNERDKYQTRNHRMKIKNKYDNVHRRRRQWHPTPVLLPGKSHGWRSLEGCSPWGH